MTEKEAKAADAKAERFRTGRVTGRELTEMQNFTFEDDDLAGDSNDYTRDVDIEAQFVEAAEEARKNLAAAKASRGADEAGPSGSGGAGESGSGSGGVAGVAGLSAALAAELEDLGEDELGDDDDEARSTCAHARAHTRMCM